MKKERSEIRRGILAGLAVILMSTGMSYTVSAAEKDENTDSEWEIVSGILDSYPGIYTEDTPLGSPWDTTYSPDGPFMGNGTVYAFVAGDHKEQNLYISHSNMWQDRTMNNGQEYTTFGGLTIKKSEEPSVDEKKQDFRYEQDMKNAEVTAQSEDGFTTKTWLSAKENIIVTEIKNETTETLPIEISGWTANANTGGEVKGDIMIATKAGVSKAKSERPSGDGTWEGWTVNIAMASKIIDDIEKEVKNVEQGRNTIKFTLNPEESVTLVSAVEGGKETKTENTMEQAKQKAVDKLNTRLTKVSLDGAKQRHRDYWKDYWLKSYIDIQDEKIERMYYGMLYQLGCSTSVSSENNGGVAAGLFPWTAAEHPAWQGDYTTNTDFQRQIHPLVTANRTSGIQNYINIVKQYWPEAQRRSASQEHLNWIIDGTQRPDQFTEGIPDGALFPTHIGPWGASTEQYDNKNDYWNSPADATSVLVPIIKLWKYTQDDKLLQELYPMMKSVATFWEKYITFEDGKYVVYGATHEGVPGRNPILDVDACKYMLKNTILAADQLGVDIDRIKTWQNIVDNMSDVPTMEYRGKTMICDVEGRTESNPGNTFDNNPVTIQSVYYFDSIGMSESPEEKEKYINYLDVKNGLGNHRRLISATRLGYDIHEIMDQLKAGSITPNPSDWEGIRGNNTIGDIGVTGRMAIIQDSLIQSNEGFINIFANWYDDQATSFRRLRTENAFLVDADMNEFGQVTYTHILSEKGRKCSVLNPWRADGLEMKVYKDGREVQTSVEENSLGDVYIFKTEAGGTYNLVPTEKLPEKIEIAEEDVKLFIEDTLELNVKTNVEGDIVWKSSDDKTAKVKNGVVTPLRFGEVEITAVSADDEKIFDTCIIHVVNSVKIPSEKLRAVADSEENNGSDGPASSAVDGSESTYWHSGYSDGKVKPDIANNNNNTITIDLGTEYKIGRLEYVPRQSGSNGTIAKYEIWCSKEETGDDFTKISEGSWESDAETKTAEFAPADCRRLRIRAMETYGDNQWISAAEFYPYKVAEKVGNIVNIIAEIPQLHVSEDTPWTDVLKLLPEQIEAELSTGAKVQTDVEWNAASYSGESGTITGKLVCSGKITNTNNVQAEVEIIVEKIDREGLQKIYDKYHSMEHGLYTNESWAALQEALKYAKSILEKEDVSASEMLEAKIKLESMARALKEIEGIELAEEEVTVYLDILKKMSVRNNTDKTLKWSSENDEIVTVDEDGVITPVSVGTATVTVSTEDTEYTDTCEVHVQRNERNYNRENPMFTECESGHHEDFVPENVADGKTGGNNTEYAWVSKNIPIEAPRWIAVSFENPVAINKWRVTHVDTDGTGGSITRNFELQVSENGKDWATVDTVTDNKELVTERAFADNGQITSKYFRLYITEADNYNGQWPNNMARIDEWELLFEYGNYTVEFLPGEAEGEAHSQELRYNEEKILDANTFTRKGYVFDSWSDEEGNRYKDGQAVTNLTPERDGKVVFTAQWRPVNYTVSYDLNGGEGKMPESIKCSYDTEVILASTDGITRGDYEIKGWNTKADGSGTDYMSEEYVSNLTAKEGETVILYAKWTKTDIERSIDKSVLKTIVENADKIDVKLYTEESVKSFEKVLKKAKELLSDESLSAEDQEKVDMAVNELKQAIDSLELMDHGTIENGDDGNNTPGSGSDNNDGTDTPGSDNNTGNNTSGNDSKDNNQQAAVKTGDLTSLVLPIIGISTSIISLIILGLVLLRKRHK